MEFTSSHLPAIGRALGIARPDRVSSPPAQLLTTKSLCGSQNLCGHAIHQAKRCSSRIGTLHTLRKSFRMPARRAWSIPMVRSCSSSQPSRWTDARGPGRNRVLRQQPKRLSNHLLVAVFQSGQRSGGGPFPERIHGPMRPGLTKKTKNSGLRSSEERVERISPSPIRGDGAPSRHESTNWVWISRLLLVAGKRRRWFQQ